MKKLKEFLADDFALHVYAGLIIAIVSGMTAHIWLSPFVSGLIGLFTGTLAGFVKEFVWDLWLKKGVFSWRDIFATFWGACLGAIILAVIFNIHNGV